MRELDKCVLFTPEGGLAIEGAVRHVSAQRSVIATEGWGPAQLTPYVGAPMRLRVFSDHKGQCTFETQLLQVGDDEVVIGHVSLLEVSQEREAVRVRVALRLRVTHFIVDDVTIPLPEPLAVIVADISAHGMRIVTSADLQLGQQLMLTFPETDQPVDLVLEVLRREENRGTPAYGCRFVDLGERETDLLVRYVFQQQALQRRQLHG